MKRVLVLGATGTLGYAVHRKLHDAGLEVFGGVRSVPPVDAKWARNLLYTDLGDFTSIPELIGKLRKTRWDYIINCVAAKAGGETNSEASFEVLNARLPLALGRLATDTNTHLVHFSTDGVFLTASGAPFSEDDTPVAAGLDAYSRSKLMGEQVGPHTLTIRTSMIGIAPLRPSGLLPWILTAEGPTVRGYANYVFTGLPVTEIANCLSSILRADDFSPEGILHLPGPAISKYELLRLCLKEWGREDLNLKPIEKPAIDLRLRTVRQLYEPTPALSDWPTMLHRLREFYDQSGF